MDCGERFHPAAMTFDHRPDTEKIGDLAELAGRGLTGLFDLELPKCDLVCANCHAIRTFLRREEARRRRAGEPATVSEDGLAYVIRAA